MFSNFCSRTGPKARGGGGTWIQNDGGVHVYDNFCKPALEKIAKNDTRH